MNAYLLVIILDIDIPVFKIEDGKQKKQNITGQLIGYIFENIYQ